MTGKTVELKDDNGNSYRTYLSVPAKTPAPGVVIGLDIFGLRPLFHEVADLFAEHGYLAAVPDYFWDVEPNDDGNYRGKYDFSTMVDVTRTTMDRLKSMADCNGRIAVIGFCAGGNTAFVAAARFGADAAASYYGTRLHTLLDEAAGIDRPVLLHIAEHDETYSDADRDRILSAVEGNPNIVPYIYDAPHGFATSSVVEDARALAHQRTFDLFERLK